MFRKLATLIIIALFMVFIMPVQASVNTSISVSSTIPGVFNVINEGRPKEPKGKFCDKDGKNCKICEGDRGCRPSGDFASLTFYR